MHVLVPLALPSQFPAGRVAGDRLAIHAAIIYTIFRTSSFYRGKPVPQLILPMLLFGVTSGRLECASRSFMTLSGVGGPVVHRVLDVAWVVCLALTGVPATSHLPAGGAWRLRLAPGVATLSVPGLLQRKQLRSTGSCVDALAFRGVASAACACRWETSTR